MQTDRIIVFAGSSPAVKRALPRPACDCDLRMTKTALEKDTRRKLQDTNAALAKCRQQLRQLSRLAARPNAQAPLPRLRCHSTWDTAMRIFVLTSDKELAVQYVRSKRARSERETCLAVDSFRRRMAALSDDERHELLQATTASSTRRLAEAKAFLQQANLQDWLRKQNVNKALAPTACQVYTEWQRLQRSRLPADAGFAGRGHKHSRYRLQWVRRWARRFAVVRGRFKVGSRLPLEDARERVGRQKKNKRSHVHKNINGATTKT
jgi:hypothetical protein